MNTQVSIYESARKYLWTNILYLIPGYRLFDATEWKRLFPRLDIDVPDKSSPNDTKASETSVIELNETK